MGVVMDDTRYKIVMDDKMARVVKQVVKELETVLKSVDKPKKSDRDSRESNDFDGVTGSSEEYISCYLSGQIPEDEWHRLTTQNKDLMDAWNKHCGVMADNIKEMEVMADNAVRTTFEEIIEVVLAHEGGFVDDPDDRGGATNWGVTQAVWEDFLEDEFTSEDVKGFTREQAIELYKEEFWIPSQSEKLPEEIREVYFDMCVNHGQRNAVKILQSAVNAKGGNIEVDGGIGPNTIKASSVLKLWELQVERSGFYWNLVFVGSFYGKRNNQAKFIRGWIRRCFNLE